MDLVPYTNMSGKMCLQYSNVMMVVSWTTHFPIGFRTFSKAEDSRLIL